MMPNIETSGDDAAKQWSTMVNWEEDRAIKKKWSSSFKTCNMIIAQDQVHWQE